MEIETVKDRDDFGDEIYEKEDFQQIVRKEYKRFENHKYWKIINANQDKDKVHSNIVENLEILMKEYQSNSLDEFNKNFYPNSIGEDLFMYKDV